MFIVTVFFIVVVFLWGVSIWGCVHLLDVLLVFVCKLVVCIPHTINSSFSFSLYNSLPRNLLQNISSSGLYGQHNFRMNSTSSLPNNYSVAFIIATQILSMSRIWRIKSSPTHQAKLTLEHLNSLYWKHFNIHKHLHAGMPYQSHNSVGVIHLSDHYLQFLPWSTSWMQTSHYMHNNINSMITCMSFSLMASTNTSHNFLQVACILFKVYLLTVNHIWSGNWTTALWQCNKGNHILQIIIVGFGAEKNSHQVNYMYKLKKYCLEVWKWKKTEGGYWDTQLSYTL